MFWNNSFFDSYDLKNYVNKLVDKKLSEIKVRIPQEQINDAVVKFFTEKKWFLTEDGKKLDTYDLIRKFAMNTIGVAENGELKPELLKVVQAEVANIIAKEGIKAKSDPNFTWSSVTYTNSESEPVNNTCTCKNKCNDKEDKESLAKEYESMYNAGWTDCFDHLTDVITCNLNNFFEKNNLNLEAVINYDNDEPNVYIVNDLNEVTNITEFEENPDGVVPDDKDESDEVKPTDTDCAEAENETCDSDNESKVDINKLKEELFGKSLTKEEKEIIKDYVNTLNKLFDQSTGKTKSKKKK